MTKVFNFEITIAKCENMAITFRFYVSVITDNIKTAYILAYDQATRHTHKYFPDDLYVITNIKWESFE